MSIKDFFGKLNIKENLDKITEQLETMVTFSEEDTKSYYEMVYGLYFSRGLDAGAYDWAVSKEKIINYIEFHLDKPCNRIVLVAVLMSLDYNGYYYYFPTEGSKLEKLNNFKDSDNYKYSDDLAHSIADTKLADLQSIVESFNNEKAKKYYLASCGLLSSMKNGISYEGIKNYLEYKLDEVCDEEILKNIADIFEQSPANYSTGSSNLYYLKDNAKRLYLNKKVFGSDTFELDEANTYKCSLEEAYRICYPEIIGNIDTEYQKIMATFTDNVKQYENDLLKFTSKYGSLIGRNNIVEYFKIVTREKYFRGDAMVKYFLIAWLEVSLWELQKMNWVTSVALRALHFSTYEGTEDEYQSVSEEECRGFVLNNDAYLVELEKHSCDKEKYIEQFITEIKNLDVYYGARDKSYLPTNNKEDSYYIDAVCNSYLKDITKNFKNGAPNDPNKVYNIIWSAIALSDEERQRRENKELEKQRMFEESLAKIGTQETQKAEPKVFEEIIRNKEAEERAKADARIKQKEEPQQHKEENKVITYYCFGPLDRDGVNVISHTNNVWAAKKAMLNMYGKSESDIKFYSATERKDCSNYFDGRNSH